MKTSNPSTFTPDRDMYCSYCSTCSSSMRAPASSSSTARQTKKSIFCQHNNKTLNQRKHSNNFYVATKPWTNVDTVRIKILDQSGFLNGLNVWSLNGWDFICGMKFDIHVIIWSDDEDRNNCQPVPPRISRVWCWLFIIYFLQYILHKFNWHFQAVELNLKL